MKNIIIVVLFMSTFFVGQSQPIEDISLNGEWKFLVDSSNTSFSIYQEGLPVKAQKVIVPHTWNVQPGLENYYGKGWY
jgi:beta-galactosidase/beta-glucuronidase